MAIIGGHALARDKHVSGVTMNPTIFARPIADRTVAEARALWWLVGRPSLLIKIPAARRGLLAITACPAEGISINVTLIFSLARSAEVIEAFLSYACRSGHR
jgi:transaldolase